MLGVSRPRRVWQVNGAALTPGARIGAAAQRDPNRIPVDAIDCIFTGQAQQVRARPRPRVLGRLMACLRDGGVGDEPVDLPVAFASPEQTLAWIEAAVELIEMLDLRRIPPEPAATSHEALQEPLLEDPVNPSSQRVKLAGLQLPESILPEREQFVRTRDAAIEAATVGESLGFLQEPELEIDRGH